MRRRSYLLFELLLAFVFLSSLLFPLLKSHFVIMSKEIEKVEKMQLDRMKEALFAEIQHKLYENREFPFKKLKKGATGSLENVRVYTAKNRCKSFTINYELKPIESCCRKKGIHENYLLLEAHLHLIPPHQKKGYDYQKTFLLREYE